MATIILLGLENDLAFQLSRVLRQHEHNVKLTDSLETVAFQRDVDIVFAGGDGPDYREIVRQLTALRPGLRVVLVNRLPKTPAGSTPSNSGPPTTAAPPSSPYRCAGWSIPFCATPSPPDRSRLVFR